MTQLCHTDTDVHLTNDIGAVTVFSPPPPIFGQSPTTQLGLHLYDHRTYSPLRHSSVSN